MHQFKAPTFRLFELQPDKAIALWEKSRELDSSLATVHRNLGWANYRVKNDVAGAINCYERALACGDLAPRLFLELDRGEVATTTTVIRSCTRHG